MNLPVTVNQSELLDILLNIAPSRPVFIWGAPGIGKSALVEEFAIEVGLECVFAYKGMNDIVNNIEPTRHC